MPPPPRFVGAVPRAADALVVPAAVVPLAVVGATALPALVVAAAVAGTVVAGAVVPLVVVPAAVVPVVVPDVVVLAAVVGRAAEAAAVVRAVVGDAAACVGAGVFVGDEPPQAVSTSGSAKSVTTPARNGARPTWMSRRMSPTFLFARSLLPITASSDRNRQSPSRQQYHSHNHDGTHQPMCAVLYVAIMR